jgi:hypothetical protein
MTSSGIQATEKATAKQFAEFSGFFCPDSDKGFAWKLDVAGVNGTAGDSFDWKDSDAVSPLATGTSTLGLFTGMADEERLLRCLTSVMAGEISARWLSCFIMLATGEEGTAEDPGSGRAKLPACRVCTVTQARNHV